MILWFLGYIGIGIIVVHGLEAILEMLDKRIQKRSRDSAIDVAIEILNMTLLSLLWPMIIVLGVLLFVFMSFCQIMRKITTFLEILSKHRRR